MLFLFSDVGENDAPTRIRVGSHLRIPKLLAPMGEYGLSAMEIGVAAAQETCSMQEISATGPCRNGVPLSSIPGARSATSSWGKAAIYGATAADPASALRTGAD